MPKPTPPPKPKAPAEAEPTASSHPARLPGKPTERQIMDTMVKRSISREEAVRFLSQPPVEQDVKRRMAAGLTREQAETASSLQAEHDSKKVPGGTDNVVEIAEPSDPGTEHVSDREWISEELVRTTQAEQLCSRQLAIDLIKVGFISPSEIAVKTAAGLSREHAIQAIQAQRENDRRTWEAAKVAKKASIGKEVPSRFVNAAKGRASSTIKP